MTCEERLRQLEDENLLLKEALGMTYQPEKKFKLSPMEAKVVGIIARNQQGASTERLMTAVYAHTDEPGSLNAMKVRISNARKKLRPFGIEIKSYHGLGYWMERDSRQKALINPCWLP